MSAKSKSNFGGLKNSELIFMSFIIKDVLKSFQVIIDEKGISNKLTLPDGSFLESFQSLDDQHIEEIIASKKYTYITDIHSKLNDVSSLIHESFPDIYKEVEDMFNKHGDNQDFLL